MNLGKTIGVAGLMGVFLAFTASAPMSSSQAMTNDFANIGKTAAAADHLHEARHNDRRWGRSERRRHWRRHERRYNNDINPGAFIALGVIGALIERGMNESSARTAMERCDRRFVSFEWDTGLYTTYGGEKRLCPYLR